MRVRRKLTAAKILGPRRRCWRCQGQRFVETADLTLGARRYTQCPSCNGRGPQTVVAHCTTVSEEGMADGVQRAA
jgi:hypothetical protein